MGSVALVIMSEGPNQRRRLNRVLLPIARFVLLAASVVALMSFGGQLLLAPVLVPLQWWAARTSDRQGLIVFTTLATLLMFEVGWMGGYIFTENELLSIAVALVWGAVAGGLFYRTASDRRAVLNSGPTLAS